MVAKKTPADLNAALAEAQIAALDAEAEKCRAEAEKHRAGIARDERESGVAIEKTNAEAEKYEAEAALKRAEAARHGVETQVVELSRQQSEIGLAQLQRAEEMSLAQNINHCVYPFVTEINGVSVGDCIKQLTYWMRTKPSCAIEIVFNSPGGGVIEGLALFDFIQQVRAAGHHVTTSALGMAASLAATLLQAGDKRVMGKETWVLIHEGSFGVKGKIGEVEDATKWMKMVHTRILKIFASRSKLTEKKIAARWKRTDWWLSSDDCLKYGLVDEVR